MREVRVAALRIIWRWLGYKDGLPVNMADLERFSKQQGDDIVRRVAIAVDGGNRRRRQTDIAATLLSGTVNPTPDQIDDAFRKAGLMLDIEELV